MSHKAIPDSSDEYCGTSYAAKLLNLSVGTVQTLVEKNELEAWKTQGGHRRISLQSIRNYQSRASLSPNAIYQEGKRLKVMLVEDDEAGVRAVDPPEVAGPPLRRREPGCLRELLDLVGRDAQAQHIAVEAEGHVHVADTDGDVGDGSYGHDAQVIVGGPVVRPGERDGAGGP